MTQLTNSDEVSSQFIAIHLDGPNSLTRSREILSVIRLDLIADGACWLESWCERAFSSQLISKHKHI